MLNILFIVLFSVLTSVTDNIIYLNNKAFKQTVKTYIMAKAVKDKDLNTLARASARVLNYVDRKTGDFRGGTAVLLGGDLALTARHVVEGSELLIVQLDDGFPLPAELVKYVGDLDVAIIRVQGLTAQFYPEYVINPEYGTVGILHGHPEFTSKEMSKVLIIDVLPHYGPNGSLAKYLVFMCNGTRPGFSGAAVFNPQGQIMGIMSFYNPIFNVCLATSMEEIVNGLN